MPTFNNTRTGRVVEVPDEAPTRRNRPKRDRQWSGKINRMDRSKRWRRVDIETAAAAADDEPKPKAADVRAWAKEQGLDVPAKGKLPDELVEAYRAAQVDADDVE